MDDVVMCADCFWASEHRKHRYRERASNGGYCDCGDEEAFIMHATCDTHKKLKASGDTNVSHGLSLLSVHTVITGV
jgi:hypothetical protein